MKGAENCPKKCKHARFHFCMESGTHCSKHCTCACPGCAEERKLEKIRKSLEEAEKT